MLKPILLILLEPLRRYFERYCVLRIDSGDAPDYTPVANASEEAARISSELGHDQLDEARRQYDLNMGVVRPVVDAQIDIMREQLSQGRESYGYAKTFRPLEQQMLRYASDAATQLEANKAERDFINDVAQETGTILGGRANYFDRAQLDDLALMTGPNSGITAKYGADIENDVGTAVADARAGQTQTMNSAIRQAMRYGLSVPAALGGVTTQGASQIAAAANNTRTNATNNYRNIVAQGIGARNDVARLSQAFQADALGRRESALTAKRNQRIQDEGIAWGHAMDTAGLGRGMVGASQGAYGLAASAGSQAAQNQMASSNVLMNGMNQAANTTMQGRQIAMQGLTAAAGGSGGDNGLSGLIGGALGAWASTGFAWSDRRLKRDVRCVGATPGGLPLYRFRYLDDDEVHIGVMADEVRHIPGAVRVVGGFEQVDYSCLH